MPEMLPMKKLTIKDKTFEIVDESSRESITEINATIARHADAINVLTNGTDPGVIDGVNDLINYVNTHGSVVTGIKKDISNLESKVGTTPVADQISEAVSSSVADWHQTDSNAVNYIKNKPPIKTGTGSNSIVIGDGTAQGQYSVAGGTNDKQLAKNILGYDLSEISDTMITQKLGERGLELKADVQKVAEANGDMSVAYGSGAKTVTPGSIAMGLASKAGAKGFYWFTFDFDNNKIQLTTTQDRYSEGLFGFGANRDPKWDTNAANILSNWKAGDALTIILVESIFPFKCKITAIDATNGVLTVDKLPFTSEDAKISGFDGLKLAPDDCSVCNPMRPEHGVVGLGFGGLTHGFGTIAAGSFSQAYGRMSVAAMQYAHAEGFETIAAGEASHSEGRETQAIANYAHAEGGNTIASEMYAHAEGCDTKASGSSSHTEGYLTEAKGGQSHAEGYDTIAEGNFSHAEGAITKSIGEASHAEGAYTEAEGNYSHSEGKSTKATKEAAHSEGLQTEATGDYAHAEGCTTIASGNASHSEGYLTKASGEQAHAEGCGRVFTGYVNVSDYVYEFSYWGVGNYTLLSNENKDNIVVGTIFKIIETGNIVKVASIGQYNSDDLYQFDSDPSLSDGFTAYEVEYLDGVALYTEASGKYSHAEGYQTKASGQSSHAEGSKTVASGANAHAEGANSTASGVYSHTEGADTIASNSAAHAEGYLSQATGQFSHAEGHQAFAEGTGSHAEGYKTEATGEQAHAEGRETIAAGSRCHAEGYFSQAYGNASHAEGYNTYASGSYNHAEGSGTKALNFATHAEGINTTASDEGAHAEGKNTHASGFHSHAEGAETYTDWNAPNSHAEGYQSKTYGNNAHAEGEATIAKGTNSHAEGNNTIAISQMQHVQGKWNILDVKKDSDGNMLDANGNITTDIAYAAGGNKYAHIVGNGSSETERSNAHTIDWGGNAWFKGGIYVGGNGQDDGATRMPMIYSGTDEQPSESLGQVGDIYIMY